MVFAYLVCDTLLQNSRSNRPWTLCLFRPTCEALAVWWAPWTLHLPLKILQPLGLLIRQERKDLLQQEFLEPQEVIFTHHLMSALRPVRLLEPSELRRRKNRIHEKEKKMRKNLTTTINQPSPPICMAETGAEPRKKGDNFFFLFFWIKWNFLKARSLNYRLPPLPWKRSLSVKRKKRNKREKRWRE